MLLNLATCQARLTRLPRYPPARRRWKVLTLLAALVQEYPIYLLHQYKSTNTDAEVLEVLRLTLQLVVSTSGESCVSRDAAAAGSGAGETQVIAPTTNRSQAEGTQFTCFTSTKKYKY